MQKRTYLYKLLIFVLLFGSSAVIFASVEYECLLDHGEVALRQALVDLTNHNTILCLAAHPDDEDGATLTYYRKKYGVNTGIILVTRGEGGQNEIGPELYEELGVIRAFETEAAAEIYGAEVYNLNKRDFGYSKSAEEAFRIWGHEDSLSRLVRIIRTVKPDVIITNHDTEHGHGHHQATGIMALEAFEAAADPNSFPEQMKEGLNTWQVKRLFLRSGKEDADLVINVGEYDPLRGYSYAQIANEGLKMHKSQGMGGKVRRGPVYRYYKLIRSSKPAQDKLNSLLDGLTDDESPRMIVPEFLRGSVQESLHREKLTNNMLDYLLALSTMDVENPILDEQKRELEYAIARALDLYLRVEPDDKIITKGQSFNVRLSLVNCGKQTIRDIEFALFAPKGWDVENDGSIIDKLEYNETATAVFSVKVALNAPFTMPHAEHLYQNAFMKPLLKGAAKYKIRDTSISITSEGTVEVVPDLEFQILPSAAIIPVPHKQKKSRYIVNVINRLPQRTQGEVEFIPSQSWVSHAVNMQEFTIGEDQQAFVAFDVNIPPDTTVRNFTLTAKALYKKSEDTTNSISENVDAKLVDVEVANDLYAGYVKSYDNTLERALKQLNVKSRALDGDDLRFGDLSLYDTIIIDIRAYLVRDDLIESNQRLMDYVKNGGNLVVMYHKTYEWNGNNYAPYKLTLSRDRVTVEEAPITILEPEHPLFNFPNRIGDSEWEGWIQERGLYFPSEWASEYEELLSCSDPNEKPLKGGYLVAQYGKGTYIYTSYVWYRQLHNLNPGAFRNFANMLSLPKYSAMK
jgi:LmbE family N-acetylglucosaminyl deacetylase